MDREKELAYLERAEQAIRWRIAELELLLGSRKSEIIDNKRSLWQVLPELRSWEAYAIRESIEGEMTRYAGERRTLHTLYRQKDSPYFGRIDFLIDGDTEICYIGLANLTDPESSDILVYDWRAPISSLYYYFELGPAHFSAPSGEVRGEITGKYQYKIADGRMQYMFDSHITIQDEILQRELSANTSERMKTIVATIQREQNKIIRAGKEKTLIVQGAAGSGKTSIALHRVAYLLYQYRDTLNSNNILIISPSGLFSSYIAGVLPELGEESIIETSLQKIAEKQLGPAFSLENRFSYLDHCLSCRGDFSEEMAERIRFKGSAEFVRLMQEYIARRAEEIYQPQDVTSGGVDITRDKLLSLYRGQLSRLAPLERIQKLRAFVQERAIDCAGKKALKKAVREQLEQELNAFESYGELLDEYNRFIYALNSEGYPAGQELTPSVLFEDVSPLLLFSLLFFGKPDYRFVRHLLVDEMQDYTPVQYAILNLLFSCPKTILGDADQAIDPLSPPGTLSALREIYGEEGVYLKLSTSYRSTAEITAAARAILGKESLPDAGRHGERPVLTRCSDEARQQEAILASLAALQGEGYGSIAILCKTKQAALQLFGQLHARAGISLLTDPDGTYASGALITTCAAAKGLEFDCALLPDCDGENYPEPFGRRVLYVCATRALHRLRLFCGPSGPAGCLQPALRAGLIEEKG